MKKKTTRLAIAAAILLTASVVIAVRAGAPFVHPKIEGHGKVVRLPYAADQPRPDSKICVDLTIGGPVDSVNPGLEKVARFVNIYAGAGKQAASCSFTVILHGDATAVALSDAAYASRFAVKNNPSLPLLKQLKHAGVEFLVCGQALGHQGFAYQNVAEEVTLAVSALTVNVNRQTDGVAYIPLH